MFYKHVKFVPLLRTNGYHLIHISCSSVQIFIFFFFVLTQNQPPNPVNTVKSAKHVASSSQIKQRFDMRTQRLRDVCSRPEYQQPDLGVDFSTFRYDWVAFRRLRWCRVAKVRVQPKHKQVFALIGIFFSWMIDWLIGWLVGGCCFFVKIILVFSSLSILYFFKTYQDR